jgi:hypothetical protein
MPAKLEAHNAIWPACKSRPAGRAWPGRWPVVVAATAPHTCAPSDPFHRWRLVGWLRVQDLETRISRGPTQALWQWQPGEDRRARNPPARLGSARRARVHPCVLPHASGHSESLRIPRAGSFSVGVRVKWPAEWIMCPFICPWSSKTTILIPRLAYTPSATFVRVLHLHHVDVPC